jgi:hypothetical protein
MHAPLDVAPARLRIGTEALQLGSFVVVQAFAALEPSLRSSSPRQWRRDRCRRSRRSCPARDVADGVARECVQRQRDAEAPRRSGLAPDEIATGRRVARYPIAVLKRVAAPPPQSRQRGLMRVQPSPSACTCGGFRAAPTLARYLEGIRHLHRKTPAFGRQKEGAAYSNEGNAVRAADGFHFLYAGADRIRHGPMCFLSSHSSVSVRSARRTRRCRARIRSHPAFEPGLLCERSSRHRAG